MAHARAASLLAFGVLCWAPHTAAQSVFGYQLGVTQAVQSTFGDDPNLLLTPTTDEGDELAGEVQQLQGVQFTTAVNANVTLDLVTSTFHHGFLLGGGFTQIFPTAVPDTALPLMREQTSTAQASANYLARLSQPTYGIAFGAGYTYALNGRLENGANGAVGGIGDTIPGRQTGAFAFSGQTHIATALAQFQLNRRSWDLDFLTNYTYSQNGIYTLASGALGAQGGATALGTNVGAFVPATMHTIAPTLGLRLRLTQRNLLTATLSSAYTLPRDIDDEVTVTGTVTEVVHVPPPLPETLTNTLMLSYEYHATINRIFGADASGTLGYRVATDAVGIRLPDAALSSDTAITTVRVFYRDLIQSLELRVFFAAGVAQAHLFQPPLGSTGDPASFTNIRSDLQPVIEASLLRRFDPIDAALTLRRTLSVGALGASAVISEAADLTFVYATEVADRRLITNVGFNANRTRPVGEDQYRFASEGDAANNALTAAFNNQGFGVNAGVAMPLFASGQLSLDLAFTYNFTYLDANPNGTLLIDPTDPNSDPLPTSQTHVALLTLRGLWGRGTAQQAAGAGGSRDTDELDAFSANPADGSPLVSASLMRQGAPLGEQGARPGEEASSQRRDSRQAYRQSIRQQGIEQEARNRSDLVQSVGSYQEEERRAQEREKEEREERREKRKRTFEEWPLDELTLPTKGKNQ